MGQQRITLDHIIAAADCNDGAKNMNLNLKTLAAGLDDTFEWWGNKKEIIVCRLYNQRLLRHATYEEPAEYSEVESPYTIVKAEGYVAIICDEDGRELERLDFTDCFEDGDSDDYGDLADDLAYVIDQHNPWRDIAAEYDEAYTEWLIARAEDREAA